MAQMVEQRGETEKAIAMYRAILAKSPHDALVLHRLGVLYAEKEQYEVARAYLEKAVKLDSGNPVTLGDLGYAYYRCNRMADAERILRESLKRDPDDTTARNNFALILCVHGRTEEALAEFKKIGSDAEAHASLGFVLSQNGQSKLAQQHFRTAVSLDRSLQSTIGVLAKDTKVIQLENASNSAASPTTGQKTKTPQDKVTTTTGPPSSPASGAQQVPVRRAPQHARTARSSHTSELAGRTRRPPPDPAPEPPAFSPEIAASSPARAAPIEDAVKAEPATSPRETQLSLSPTKLAPLATKPAVNTPTAAKSIAAGPTISEPTEPRGPEHMPARDLARVEYGPKAQSPQPPPQPTMPPRGPQPADAQPHMVWNNTYEQTESAASTSQLGSVPRTSVSQNMSPQTLTQLNPITVTPQESYPETSVAPPTSRKVRAADVAAAPRAETKSLTRPITTNNPAPSDHKLVQEELAPVEESPRLREQPRVENIDAEPPKIVHLAPITGPPQAATASEGGETDRPHEANIVSPSDARWRPADRKLAESSGPPPFFNPQPSQPQAEPPQPTESAPVTTAAQLPEAQPPEPRLVDLDANRASKPIEMADIVTPANADWMPAVRSGPKSKTPPAFFTLTPPTQDADENAPAVPEPLTKPEVAPSSETDAAPPAAHVADTEPQTPVPSARLEPSEAPVPLEPLVPLAPIVTAESYKAERRDSAQMAQQADDASESVHAPVAHKDAKSWLTAYEALVREAEDVELNPTEPAMPQSSGEAAEQQGTLAPIISAQGAAEMPQPQAPGEARKEGESPQNLAPISRAAPADAKPIAQPAPVPTELPPITSAKASGLKRPEAKTFQGTLHSEGRN